jgi:DNA polymerase-3 subunit beta
MARTSSLLRPTVTASRFARLRPSRISRGRKSSSRAVIIPRKTIIELQRLLEENDQPVDLEIANNQVKLTFGDIELISKLVEGKFPDYTRVVPKGYKNNFTIGRDALLRSLQRAAIMTSDKFKGVRCIMSPGSMKISSTNADQEEAVEEIEIDYAGDSVDIGFNVTYLLDVLNNLKGDNINIALGDANSSALITVPDNPDFKYVVMPMRI